MESYCYCNSKHIHSCQIESKFIDSTPRIPPGSDKFKDFDFTKVFVQGNVNIVAIQDEKYYRVEFNNGQRDILNIHIRHHILFEFIMNSIRDHNDNHFGYPPAVGYNKIDLNKWQFGSSKLNTAWKLRDNSPQLEINRLTERIKLLEQNTIIVGFDYKKDPMNNHQFIDGLTQFIIKLLGEVQQIKYKDESNVQMQLDQKNKYQKFYLRYDEDHELAKEIKNQLKSEYGLRHLEDPLRLLDSQVEYSEPLPYQ